MWERWRSRTGATRFDTGLACCLTLYGQLEVIGLKGPNKIVGPRPVDALIFCLASLALIWRRRFPLPVVLVTVGCEVLLAVTVGSSESLAQPGTLPVIIALYSAARYDEPLRAVLATALVLLGNLVHDLRDPNIHGVTGPVVIFYLIDVSALLTGLAFRRLDRQAGQLKARAKRHEIEREERARAAVRDERARIAHELHDVIAHSVSVVIVQSVAGQGLLDKGRSDEVRRRLLAVEQTARQALSEMRRLVGILDENDVGLEPQPGVGSVGVLIDQVQKAGLRVKFAVKGEPCPLPAGLDLSVYRIIQEALTNTLKHAGKTQATVAVRFGAHMIELEVADEGPASSAAPNIANDGGHGLVGMRERVMLYGGTLQAGERDGGGYLVRARFPLEA
jgi:signal transduction histidine kinase